MVWVYHLVIKHGKSTIWLDGFPLKNRDVVQIFSVCLPNSSNKMSMAQGSAVESLPRNRLQLH